MQHTCVQKIVYFYVVNVYVWPLTEVASFFCCPVYIKKQPQSPLFLWNLFQHFHTQIFLGNNWNWKRLNGFCVWLKKLITNLIFKRILQKRTSRMTSLWFRLHYRDNFYMIQITSLWFWLHNTGDFFMIQITLHGWLLRNRANTTQMTSSWFR